MPRFQQYNPNTPREIVSGYESQWSDDVIILTDAQADSVDWAIAGYPYSRSDLRIQQLLQDLDGTYLTTIEDDEPILTIESESFIFTIE